MARPDRGHPIFAFAYSILSRFSESILGKHRRRLLARAEGVVVELGAGTGLNLRYYGPSVTEVIATEPDPHMLKRLRKAAERAPIPVEVRQTGAERLPIENAAADTAVATLVLCSVDHPAASLGEVMRVLEPGGRLLFFEHIRASAPKLAARQDKRERLWGKFSGGCHPNRDTESAIRAAGFEVEEIERFDIRGSRLTRPHILGVARKPAEGRVLASDP